VLADTSRLEGQRAAAAERGWAHASWTALGTTVELVVADPDALGAAQVAVTELIDRIDRAVSRFRADSELSQLNASGGEECTVSSLFVMALRVALDAAVWTQGLVDPTVGASVVSTGYDRTFVLLDRDGPALSVIWQQPPGWQQVALNAAAGTVQLPRGVVLDLGATAKALACDLAVEAAADVAESGVLLSLGGDVSAAGPMPEDGWPVRCADVADPSLEVADDDEVVVIRGGGLATSGTRARRWRRGGSWLHHIIDPRTGGPSTSAWVTASVIAPTCVLANAASTAAIILGDEAPGWLAAQGLSYRLVGIDGGLLRGGGWPLEGRT
jgi:FAD:protein FMN transferase